VIDRRRASRYRRAVHATTRHALFVLGPALLVACSRGPTTAPGPLGEVDLAPKLPAGVTVPSDPKSHDATHAVCPEQGSEPAAARVRWKTFTKDGAAYVSSYSVELAKSSPAGPPRRPRPQRDQAPRSNRGGRHRSDR